MACFRYELYIISPLDLILSCIPLYYPPPTPPNHPAEGEKNLREIMAWTRIRPIQAVYQADIGSPLTIQTIRYGREGGDVCQSGFIIKSQHPTKWGKGLQPYISYFGNAKQQISGNGFQYLLSSSSILNQFLLAHVKNCVKGPSPPCTSNHSLHHIDTLDECRILERRTCRGRGGGRGQVGEEILFGGVIFLDVNAGCDEQELQLIFTTKQQQNLEAIGSRMYLQIAHFGQNCLLVTVVEKLPRQIIY